MPMVFTPDYVERLHRRWANRTEKEWPLAARIGLLDYREDDRNRIEALVSTLHPDDQPKMAKNLQSEKQFFSAFGELLVGGVLINAKLAARYEPPLRGNSGLLTPDWYVDGDAALVCDVFSAGLRQQRGDDEIALRDIESRLGAIPLRYMIRLEVESASRMDSRERKAVALEVEHWLRQGRRTGEFLTFGEVTVEVLVIGGTRLEILTSEPIHLVETPAKLRENFEEKAKKYASLGLPMIGAAVKHYNAEINEDDVEDVLFGRPAYVSGQTSDGEIVGGAQRLPDGVFRSRPELSAALWIDRYAEGEPDLRFWEAPEPRLRLAPDIIEKLTRASA